MYKKTEREKEEQQHRMINSIQWAWMMNTLYNNILSNNNNSMCAILREYNQFRFFMEKRAFFWRSSIDEIRERKMMFIRILFLLNWSRFTYTDHKHEKNIPFSHPYRSSYTQHEWVLIMSRKIVWFRQLRFHHDSINSMKINS